MNKIINELKSRKRALLFGFIVGVFPSFFGIYINSIYWWIIVLPINFIGTYIDYKYFEENDDMFVKRKSNIDFEIKKDLEK